MKEISVCCLPSCNATAFVKSLKAPESNVYFCRNRETSCHDIPTTMMNIAALRTIKCLWNCQNAIVIVIVVFYHHHQRTFPGNVRIKGLSKVLPCRVCLCFQCLFCFCYWLELKCLDLFEYQKMCPLACLVWVWVCVCVCVCVCLSVC